MRGDIDQRLIDYADDYKGCTFFHGKWRKTFVWQTPGGNINGILFDEVIDLPSPEAPDDN